MSLNNVSFIDTMKKRMMVREIDVLSFYRNFLLTFLKTAGIRPKLIQSKLGQIAHLEGGEGFPLIFIHGFGASAIETWKDQLYHLSRRYRVYAPDLFWFGNSLPTDKNAYVSPKEHADAIAHWMDLQGISKAHIAGVSFGGYISQMLAIHHPDKVEKLVLIDSAGLEPTKEEKDFIKSHFDFADENLSKALVPDSVDDLVAFLKKVFYKPKFFPRFALKQVLEKDFWKNGDEKKRICDWLADNFLQQADLKQIQASTLICWGRHDRLLPLPMGERMAKFIPHSRFKIFDVSGHIPMMEESRKLNLLLERFLA